jgi:hypothetical protein
MSDPQNLENALARVPAIAMLLPTPRAQAREHVYDREEYHTNLEEAIAFIPKVQEALGTASVTMAPSPTLSDDGNQYLDL